MWENSLVTAAARDCPGIILLKTYAERQTGDIQASHLS